VEDDGKFAHPKLGAFQAAGRQPADIAKEIKKRIEDRKLLKRADVAVYIAARRQREVIVSGAVGQSGRQFIKDGAVLSDAIEQASPKPGADFSRVVLSRAGKDTEVNYLKFRNGASNAREFNPPLEDGDRIFVYEAAPTEGTVRIEGEVKDPTKLLLPLTQGLTVGQALQIVGGLTDFADRKAVIIERKGLVIYVPYDEIQRREPGKDIALEDKDVVKVPRLERPRAFTVAGAVQRGQTFTLTTKTTLLQAIAQAGGTQDGAQQNKVEVRRTDYTGKVTTTVYDLKKDDAATVAIAENDYIFVPFGRRRPSLDVATVVGVLSGLALLFSALRQ
jgi:protein involved in polysaccharide export with SLBB domain